MELGKMKEKKIKIVGKEDMEGKERGREELIGEIKNIILNWIRKEESIGKVVIEIEMEGWEGEREKELGINKGNEVENGRLNKDGKDVGIEIG